MTIDPSTIGMMLAALLLGAAGGWFVAMSRGRLLMAEAATRLEARVAAAEARVEEETERRRDLEGELRAVDTIRSELDRSLAAAEVELAAGRRQLTEQAGFLESTQKQLKESFSALASDTLETHQRQFLELAEQRWSVTREQAAKDLDERRQGFEGLLTPLKETLGKLDQRTREIERERQNAYSGLKEHLGQLKEATHRLHDTTTSLSTALRGSQARGRWGELALRNVAELAGMAEHCDFIEQSSTDDGGRPDMVVSLPEGRLVAVDAKVPLSGYLKSIESAETEARDQGLKEHVAAVRTHIRTLAGRDYAASLEGDVDLVVLFLPGDAFLSAAFSSDPELQVEALRSRVLIATPTTLVALLRTVAIYHQQRSLADNARHIADTARLLYDRAAKFSDDLAKMGRGLKTAVDAYNTAVGSFERRLLPVGQRLAELKVSDQARRELVAPEGLAVLPRDAANATAVSAGADADASED